MEKINTIFTGIIAVASQVGAILGIATFIAQFAHFSFIIGFLFVLIYILVTTLFVRWLRRKVSWYN